jgi:tetraacyldisaccharide 4'-kinase
MEQMSFKHWISKLHYQPGRLSPWLWFFLPLSLTYQLIIHMRYQAYHLGILKTTEPSVPVISVGNLTTGGTGKTPIVIELAKGLIASGKTVVILSRGYGASEPLPYARALDPKHGDEAYLIQAQVPEAIVIVGRDRVQTLSQAVQDYRPDFVLLDDGFQYLPLQRQMNILLIDGEKIFGNNNLLPAGPLRETLSAMHRADLILVTKQVSTESMKAVENLVSQHGGKPRPTVLPVPFQANRIKPLLAGSHISNALQDQSVIAFSGIAQPEQFERALKLLGANIIHHECFSDHHVYSDNDISNLVRLLEKHTNSAKQVHPLFITTEKDLVKVATMIPTAWQPFTAALQIQPALDGKWFYSEFITQMIGETAARTADVS